MTFVESIKHCLKQYATFSGRASRSEFWWFVLFQLLVTAGGQLISQVLGGLLSLALLLPILAVTARRLHDIGKSGWLQLLAIEQQEYQQSAEITDKQHIAKCNWIVSID